LADPQSKHIRIVVTGSTGRIGREVMRAFDALSGSDVVVHLSNFSYPGFHPDHKTFAKNVNA
jgi:uncharacterized protein YbjT (DUF2867 family)